MNAELICIEARWHDTGEQFERRCLIIPPGFSDEMRQVILDDYDNTIFFVFDSREQVIGRHNDFTVYFFNPLRSLT